MSMRIYIAQLLRDNAIDLGMIPNAVLAGDVDTPAERPFINLRWTNTVRGIGGVAVRRNLNVWVHDHGNDYVRIDDILLAIRKLFGEIEGANHGSGYIIQIDWQDDSQDLVDTGHRTIARYSTYRVIGTEGIQEDE